MDPARHRHLVSRLDPARQGSRQRRLLGRLKPLDTKRKPAKKKVGKKEAVERLVEAAGRGDVSRVRKLLRGSRTSPKSGETRPLVRVDKRNANGGTALIEAAVCGHVAMVQYLLGEAGARVNHTTRRQVTALMGAAGRGHVDVVRALLSARAVANAKTTDGSTALMAACDQSQADTARMLIKARADVNAAKQNGSTAFTIAAEKGPPLLLKALALAGANVDARTSNGSTALMYAAYRGKLELVRHLIEKEGCDFEAKCAQGRTARDWAQVSKRKRVADYLKFAEEEPPERWEKVRTRAKAARDRAARRAKAKATREAKETEARKGAPGGGEGQKGDGEGRSVDGNDSSPSSKKQTFPPRLPVVQSCACVTM